MSGADPFVGAATGDFRLKSAAPLMGKAAPLPDDIAALRRPSDAQNVAGAFAPAR